jgi:hypothetical protein
MFKIMALIIVAVFAQGHPVWAADDNVPTEPPVQSVSADSLAVATDWVEKCRAASAAESRYCVVCVSVGGSNASTDDARGFCLASDLDTAAGGVANFSAANTITVSGLNNIQTPASAFTSPAADSAGQVRCKSLGGSEASPEAGSGVCLAADLRMPGGDPVAFALANGSVVKGLQFMQVSFRGANGNPAQLPPASSVGPTDCQSASGSKSLTSSSGGFCMSADLVTSGSNKARFTVANDLPVAAVQFLQLSLDDQGSATSNTVPAAGTHCASAMGTNAASGLSSGFCLASDLSTANAALASFSFANLLPIKGLQFLQMTFADPAGANLEQQFWGSGSSSAGNCVSAKNSMASTGTEAGFCLASDLSSVQGDFAELAIANGLPIASMQFLQATFSIDSALANLTGPPGRYDLTTAHCVSAGGTSSGAANPSGFCLAADRGKADSGLANLTLANDLPVTALQFLQIPLGVKSIDQQSSNLPGFPRGILISDAARKRSEGAYRPALGSTGIAMPRYFSFSARRQLLRAYMKSQQRLPRTLSVWINRTIRSSSAKRIPR